MTDGLPLVPLEGEAELCSLGDGSFKENKLRYYPALARPLALQSARKASDRRRMLFAVGDVSDRLNGMVDLVESFNVTSCIERVVWLR